MPGFLRRKQIQFAAGMGGYSDFALADRLHMTLEEVRSMPNQDYLGWIAYLRLENERATNAARRARALSGKRKR